MAVLLPSIRIAANTAWRGKRVDTPSGGKLSGGVVVSTPHPYNSKGFGSNSGGN